MYDFVRPYTIHDLMFTCCRYLPGHHACQQLHQACNSAEVITMASPVVKPGVLTTAYKRKPNQLRCKYTYVSAAECQADTVNCNRSFMHQHW